MLSDLYSIIIWWGYIFLLGLIFLPVASRLFNKFFDKGYLFSKALGIAVFAYTSWLLASVRAVPFRRISIFAIMAAAAFIIPLIFKKSKSLKDIIVENRKVFIIEEIMFLLAIAVWAYVRCMQPDILGLEKYMDFGFVNCLLRSDYMPAKDMWFAGKNINYYYFGHFVCAFLTKLTGIKSAITYNLMLATIFSFMFNLTFSIAANLVYRIDKRNYKKIIAAGLISASLLSLGGNLHGFIYGLVLPKAKTLGIYSGQTNFYYPDSTRFIGYNPPTNDKTIHEFPIYSLVVSDLHGHVSNAPFVLTFMALLLAYISNRENRKMDKYYGIAAVFLLGVFYMTNSWDYPIYLVAAGCSMLYKYIFVDRIGARGIRRAVLHGIMLIAASQIIDLPFTLKFENMAGGIGIVKAHTPLYQFFILWGYQLFFAIVFIIFIIIWSRKNALPADEADGKIRITDRVNVLYSADIFTIVILICAVGLLIVPEIIYIKDIYGITYHRANTMFKFTYEAFMMFAAASGYCFIRVTSGIGKVVPKAFISACLSILIAMVMVYPYFAVSGYYKTLSITNYKGLNGLDFIETKYPQYSTIIKWLDTNVKGQQAVLEASGKDFTNYNIVSMATGLPTILGWSGHEWLWRGGNEQNTVREEDEKLIYESDDIESTKQKLKLYNIKYIVIGSFEKEKYHNIKTEKLTSLGSVILDLQDAKLIEVR